MKRIGKIASISIVASFLLSGCVPSEHPPRNSITASTLASEMNPELSKELNEALKNTISSIYQLPFNDDVLVPLSENKEEIISTIQYGKYENALNEAIKLIDKDENWYSNKDKVKQQMKDMNISLTDKEIEHYIAYETVSIEYNLHNLSIDKGMITEDGNPMDKLYSEPVPDVTNFKVIDDGKEKLLSSGDNSLVVNFRNDIDAMGTWVSESSNFSQFTENGLLSSKYAIEHLDEDNGEKIGQEIPLAPENRMRVMLFSGNYGDDFKSIAKQVKSKNSGISKGVSDLDSYDLQGATFEAKTYNGKQYLQATYDGKDYAFYDSYLDGKLNN